MIIVDAPLAELAVTLEGHVMTGGWASTTVTVNDFGSALLPEASCALQVTVVVPSGKTEPEAGRHARTGLGALSSVAVTV